MAAPKCPLPLKARGLKAVKIFGPGIEPTGLICGFDTQFTVDATEAGDDKVTCEIVGE